MQHNLSKFKCLILVHVQGGGTPMFAVLWSSSSVKVHGQAKISFDLWLLLKKLCLTLVQFLVNFCKITFTQLSVKVSIVHKSMLDFWPIKNPTLTFWPRTKIRVGYIEVPPPWRAGVVSRLGTRLLGKSSAVHLCFRIHDTGLIHTNYNPHCKHLLLKHLGGSTKDHVHY